MNFSPSNTNSPDNNNSPRSVKPRRLASYLKLSVRSSESESSSSDPNAQGGIPSIEKDKKFSHFRGKIPLPFCRVNLKRLKFNSNSPKRDDKPHFRATLIGLPGDDADETHDEIDHFDPEIVVSLIDEKITCAATKTSNQLSEREIQTFKEIKTGTQTSGVSTEDLNEFLSRQTEKKPSTSPAIRNINLDYLGDDELIRLAVEIFKKSPETRNPHELKILTKCMSAVDFFKRYDQNTVQSCLKNMYYVSLNPGDIVFEMDTIGTNFWIVLTGSVSVIAKVDKKMGKDENGEDIVQKVPTEVRVLPAGSAFGELALMDNKKRAATIKCRDRCQFAVLEKAEFKAILNEKEKKNLFQQINFLVSCPILKILPYHLIHWLFYNTEVTRYSKGNVMYEEGDVCQNFYIIKSGEFKISKQIEFEEESEFGFKDPINKLMKKHMIKENVELAILGEKENFGEEEIIIGGGSRRKYTVVCNSAYAEVYEIPKDKLEKKILTYQGAIEWFRTSVDVKQKHYNQRLKTIREMRFNNKSPLVFNRQRTMSPMRLNTATYESTPKLSNFSGALTNPDYIGTTAKAAMSLTPKTRAVFQHQKKLEDMNVPGQNLLRFKNDVQLPHSDNTSLSRTKSETRGGTTVITRTGTQPAEPQPVQLSLMRISLDQLKAKRKLTRSKNDSFASPSRLFSEKRKEQGSKHPFYTKQNTLDIGVPLSLKESSDTNAGEVTLNSPSRHTTERSFFPSNTLNINELYKNLNTPLEPTESAGIYPSLSPKSKLLAPLPNHRERSSAKTVIDKRTVQNLKKVVKGSNHIDQRTERQLSPTFYNKAIARVAWDPNSIGSAQRSLGHSASQEYGKILNPHVLNSKKDNTYIFLKQSYFAQKNRDSGVMRGAFSERPEGGLKIASFQDPENKDLSSSPRHEPKSVRSKPINFSYFKRKVKRITTSTLQTDESSLAQDELRRTML